MTKQELFNTVATHLLKQNKKSINEYGNCLYRSPEGLSCAAGCLLNDEQYSRVREGHPTIEFANNDLFLSIVGVANRRLLNYLQDLHDKYDPNTWPVELTELACRYGLDDSCIKEVQA